MRKNSLIIVFLLFVFFQQNFENKAFAQYNPTGIIWVLPYRPDALPVNGNRTGNSGVNLAFEDFHVIEYKFLDSLYINPYNQKLPIYQIRLQEDYPSSEYDFIYLLHICYQSFFINIALPYYHPYVSNGELISTDNGEIHLFFYDIDFQQSLVPTSNTRSNNKHMNKILQKYDIKSYTYDPFVLDGDTVWRTISILCRYQDALPLYYDLLTLHYLYDKIDVTGFYNFNEIIFPCGQYTETTDYIEPSISIFPNPAQDEITISGVEPESVTLYDIMGKIVVSKFDPETNKMDISQLPSGFYVIKITANDGKFYTGKIVKE